MKKFLLFLLLCATPLMAQKVFQYKPLVSTVMVDSARTVSGSTLVRWLRAQSFDTSKVRVGLRIQGSGIPYGATIVSYQGTGDSLVISSAATASDTLVKTNIGYFLSGVYAASETMGWPFLVPEFKKIHSVTIVDDAATIATGTTAAFFSRGFTHTPDTVAFAPSDADMEYFQNLMTLSVITTWGANKVISQPVTALPIYVSAVPGNRLYCQLVAGGTATFTAIDNVTVTIVGE